MKSILCSFVLAFVLLAFGCTSSKSASASGTDQNKPPSNTIENPNMAVDLVEHLKKIPGLTVTGQGNDARVSIRGAVSSSSDTEPLFVINDTAINGGLSTASAMVPVADIKSVRVLKTASETSEYGIRGSNGVIIITLK